ARAPRRPHDRELADHDVGLARRHLHRPEAYRGNVERALERGGVGVELFLQIGVLLANDVEIFVGAIHVAALTPDALCRTDGRGRAVHIRDRQRLAAHERAENRRADRDRGLKLLLSELGLLTRLSVERAAFASVEGLQLRGVFAAELFYCAVAAFA